MKRAWQIASVAFVALAVLTIVLSFDYPYKDKLGPGPGFFPLWMSLITAGLSLALFIQTTWGSSLAGAAVTLRPEREGAVRILLIMGALVACLAILERLGFRISLFLFLLFLPFGLGMRNWWLILIFAVLGSFGIFHVFYYWLKVPLPVGVLGI
jgi:putative tricarboxylic transport membrane protein